MKFVLITRKQNRFASWQKVAVTTLTKRTVVGQFRFPSGLKTGQTVRLSKERLEDRLPGHSWPDDGVRVKIRVPDWRLRNAAMALVVLAGVIAGAWPYVATLAAIWAAVSLSVRHNRLRAADRLDSMAPWRFWAAFRDALAGTAMLYLVPIGAVISLYLVVAAGLTFVDGLLVLDQLVAVQKVLSAVSGFVDKWIKLKEGPMLVALVGVWLLSCLLLARQSRTGAAGSAPRPMGARYRLAQMLNRTASFYGRYSGPVAATLAALASFTFLTNAPGSLGAQTRLQAVSRTDDYTYAAHRVEAALTTEVVSQLYTRIKEAMPADYQQALVVPIPAQVARTRQQADRLTAPLPESDPAAAQRLAAAEGRIQGVRNLPTESVVTAPRGNDLLDAPGDLTPQQASAARAHTSDDLASGRAEIINEAGKRILLQTEKVASEQGWLKLKEIVGGRFPAAAPIIDALADACDGQLQELLREKIPGLVRQFSDKTFNLRAAIAATARDLAAKVDVPGLVRRHSERASQITAAEQATLADMRRLEEQLRLRTEIGRTLLSGVDFSANLDRVMGTSDEAMQKGIVDDLRKTMLAPDTTPLTRNNAAVSINQLGERGLRAVTAADRVTARRYCTCR